MVATIKSLQNVDVNKITVDNPRLFYSIYVPLGENSIIQLVDNFRKNAEINLVETDLYYFIQAKYNEFTFYFYSRGLIMVEYTTKETQLSKLISLSDEISKKIHENLKYLLSRYQMSLVEVFENIELIPLHKSIVIDAFYGPGFSYINSLHDMTDEKLDMYKDQLLNQMANNHKIKQYIGDTRSVNSRSYEDVIIGTKGSIIKSQQIDILLSYHSYIRSLHLFLTKYNTIIEKTWQELNKYDDRISEFSSSISQSNYNQQFSFGEIFSIFSSDYHKRLGKIKSSVINGIKNIDGLLILTNFIEDSINFTIEKYNITRIESKISKNSFHIRKILSTIEDRSKHLEIVSESLSSRASGLITRLEIYDSDIAYETEKKIEKLAFITGLTGVVLALIAIFLV